MSLRKRNDKGRKKTSTRKSGGIGKKSKKEFRMRFPHRDGMWHTVHASNREEALKQFTEGTEYDKESIVFEDEEFMGMTKEQKERIMDLKRDGMEPRTIAMLEAKTDEEVEDVQSVSAWGWTGVEGWTLEVDGGREYMVFATEKDAKDFAERLVRQDLEDTPEMFNQDWLQHHIDEDKFFNDLHSDLYYWAEEDIRDDPESHGISEKDVENENSAFEKAKKEYVENYIDNIKYEGVAEWLKGMGSEDKIIQYLDIDEAIDDAIRTDGWIHFVGSYDGNYDYLLDGSVYFRRN
jgi:hypothetical protein